MAPKGKARITALDDDPTAPIPDSPLSDPSTLPNPELDNPGPSNPQHSRDDDGPAQSPPPPTFDQFREVVTFLQTSHEESRRQQYADMKAMMESSKDSSEKVEVPPETFSGRDKRKLRSFLFTCNLNFRTNPRTYNTDRKKIAYAIGCFTDVAKQWVQEQFGILPSPTFLDDWEEFQTELQRVYSDPDIAFHAARLLLQLQMKDNQRVEKYSDDFSAIASDLQWNDPALEFMYFNGLAPRIQHQLSLVGRDQGLEPLRKQTIKLDEYYWSMANLQSAKPPAPRPAPVQIQKPVMVPYVSRPSPSSAPRLSPSRPLPKPPTSSRTTPAPPIAPQPVYMSTLGSDGHLNPEEKQRRIDNNLCLYCGKGGHRFSECRSRASRKTPPSKARASTSNSSNSLQDGPPGPFASKK